MVRIGFITRYVPFEGRDCGYLGLPFTFIHPFFSD